MLALEREEHAFGRLVRGLVSRAALLAEKIGLAALCSFAVTLVMLAGLGLFLGLDWRRAPLWLPALAAGAPAFAAHGRRDRRARARGARGVAAGLRCSRCRSRSWRSCPSGSVADRPLRRHQVVSGAFPFKPALRRARRRAQRRRSDRPPRWCTSRRSRPASRLLGAHRAAPLRLTPRLNYPGHMAFPATRLRRLRRTGLLRDLVRETALSVAHLISPMFVVARAATGARRSRRCPASTTSRSTHAVEEAGACAALGIPGVLLFGLPAAKDEEGSGAWDDEGVIQLATRAIKAAHPDLLVITDLCLCEYTSHGHCGVLRDGGSVDNDATLELLARTAVSQAEAGADVVAPSDMMDGRVGAPARRARRARPRRHADHGLLREVRLRLLRPVPRGGRLRARVRRPPRLPDGSRPTATRRCARRALDVEEGADIVMVKPALPYLDVIRRVKDAPALPVAAYNVSGEYAMIKAAAAAGLLDERAAVLEALTGIRRAGADIVITYHAKDVAPWLHVAPPEGRAVAARTARRPARRDRQAAAQPAAGPLPDRARGRSPRSPSWPEITEDEVLARIERLLDEAHHPRDHADLRHARARLRVDARRRQGRRGVPAPRRAGHQLPSRASRTTTCATTTSTCGSRSPSSRTRSSACRARSTSCRSAPARSRSASCRR